MSELSNNTIRSGILLALFALVGTSLLSYTNEVTRERIIDNERNALLKSLHSVVPADSHDNDIYHDTISVIDASLAVKNEPVTIYRATKNGQPVTAVFSSIAPDGYNGKIKLLVAVNVSGELSGVRVISHRETPGLGDAIDAERSNWIFWFNGKSLQQPAEKDWRVKKDGGIIDQFTGATVTPRAVVKAIKNTLIYYRNHKQAVFKPTQVTEVTND